MKKYAIRIVYEEEIECDAETAQELEEKLWVVHSLFGAPYEDVLIEVVDVDIEEVEE